MSRCQFAPAASLHQLWPEVATGEEGRGGGGRGGMLMCEILAHNVGNGKERKRPIGQEVEAGTLVHCCVNWYGHFVN